MSDPLLERLAAAAARGLPVVLVSRCGAGDNADGAYYRGSVDKYERRGLLVADYLHLNALQVGRWCRGGACWRAGGACAHAWL